ncbi:MAG: folylpolyglutamate synthase/dihydrofolate synthase family protein [Myxococcales bacterium]|nr:bifunctional folylpolyglutamate synthase/dihydrofolate synthase [Polyangiaceae bacterium]MDW8251430.1 folylpolyglutamate synthase/dihydrofolate synthase family protein [Myxococcales bacterium]
MTIDLPTVLRQLYALTPRGITLGLDRVLDAARRLGDIHRFSAYAHIAGTNGKGSTAAFLATMGRAAGARVGLYTSPHLCRFAERIQIDGHPIPDDLLAHCLSEAIKAGPDLSFFEVATLAAFLAFRICGVNFPVLEVGLGGRLDATNIAEGHAVPIITRIAFDHMEILGPTLRHIAREKAGILRPSTTAIVGRLHPDALETVQQVAQSLGATVYEATGPEEQHYLNSYPPSLPGPFQRQNALCAVAAARVFHLPPQAIIQGLSETRWPGRCELLETSEGYVLLDCAHNPDGALALKNALISLVMSIPRRHIALIFGAMADKNWRAMLDRMGSLAGHRVYVAPPGGRTPADPIALQGHLAGEVALSPAEALSMARRKVGRSGLVIVTGSTCLVGPLRAQILGLSMDPQVGL